ncbi:MAG: efflux RND transporter periplasmic adaptor subunit [Acidimicrobiia bacterium]
MQLRRVAQPIVIVPILIVVAIVGVWWLAFRPDPVSTASASTTKQVVDVTSGPMSVTVSAEGTVAAAQTDDLSFSSAGTVTAVSVKAGDTVKAGQVLATIDSAALRSSVTSAQSNVADAQAKLSDDQSSGASAEQIAADESSLTAANDSLTNANDALAKASLVSTFDGTVAAVNLSVGEQLSSSGSGATSGTGSASGSGQSSASIGSSNARAAGPAAASSSSSSSSSTAQIQVVSTGRYTVQLAVDSADINSVAVGQTATVTRSTSSAATGRFGGFGGFGGRFGGGNGTTGGTGQGSGTGQPSGTGTGSGAGAATPAASATGTVTDVSRIADASSGVATYPVTISFDSSGTDFYVGSTVTGAIATQQRANVIQVSSLAITTTDSGSTVSVATNGTTTGPTETRTVTTGLTSNGNTEVTSGLKPGEKVIISITRPGGAGGFTPPAGGFRIGGGNGGTGGG